jgi:hypothetical protein
VDWRDGIDDLLVDGPSSLEQSESSGSSSALHTDRPMMAWRDELDEELEQVRKTCEDLGADDEMTDLVLASHHRLNRALLEVMVARGGGMRDYVQHKLSIWEAILGDP